MYAEAQSERHLSNCILFNCLKIISDIWKMVFCTSTWLAATQLPCRTVRSCRAQVFLEGSVETWSRASVSDCVSIVHAC